MFRFIRSIIFMLILILVGYLISNMGIGAGIVIGIASIIAVYYTNKYIEDFLRAREIKKLPIAIVSVDNNTVPFPYTTSINGSRTFFSNAVSHIQVDGEEWGIIVAALLGKNLPPLQTPLISGPFAAELKIEDQTVHFNMLRSVERCSCNNPIPHWTGESYRAIAMVEVEDTTWIITMELTKRDLGKRKKNPEFKKEKERSFDMNPFPMSI